MISINPISKPVLITPDECTAKIPNCSLDSRKWIAAIELAEARFVLPILGWNLYSDICSKKNIVVDAGNIATLQAMLTAQFSPGEIPQLAVGMLVNSIDLVTVSVAYLSLWNNALWNYVFNCVWFVALTENYASFTSSGVQKSNPLDSALGASASPNVGISLNDLKYLNNRLLLDRINPLQEYLEQWICVNITQYSLYPLCKCTDKWDTSNGHIIKRTTTFVNLYEYDDNDWHRGWDSNTPIPTPVPTPVTGTCSMILTIATTPNGTLYGLCNLQTMPAQYAPSATTLTLSNLVGKAVQYAGATYNGNPVTIGPTNTGSVIGYNQATGTFDRTLQGGFNDTDVFIFLYTETM